jgi:hypothetical protein
MPGEEQIRARQGLVGAHSQSAPIVLVVASNGSALTMTALATIGTCYRISRYRYGTRGEAWQSGASSCTDGTSGSRPLAMTSGLVAWMTVSATLELCGTFAHA